MTIVTPATFYRWIRNENEPEPKRRKGGSRRPREIRDLVIEIVRRPALDTRGSSERCESWGSTRSAGRPSGTS